MLTAFGRLQSDDFVAVGRQENILCETAKQEVDIPAKPVRVHEPARICMWPEAAEKVHVTVFWGRKDLQPSWCVFEVNLQQRQGSPALTCFANMVFGSYGSPCIFCFLFPASKHVYVFQFMMTSDEEHSQVIHCNVACRTRKR